MRIGAAGKHFLEIACRGFDDFIFRIWEELLDLFLLGCAKRRGNGNRCLVKIGPIGEFVSILFQRQRYGCQ